MEVLLLNDSEQSVIIKYKSYKSTEHQFILQLFEMRYFHVDIH